MKGILEIYDEKFYREQHEKSYLSAREVIKEVSDIVGKVYSVVDVGCGVGTWLKAWRDVDSGVRILGIDGNNVDDELYYIPKECYKQIDLCSDAEMILNKLVNVVGGGINLFLSHNR